MPTKLILSCGLCPGDLCTLTAAIESLHLSYPGEYATDVRSPCPAIFEHSPRLTPIADDDQAARRIEMQYPLVNQSNQTALPFLAGYVAHLSSELERPLSLRTNRPHVFLSDDEKRWVNQVQQHHTLNQAMPFWLINAGVKGDYTAKQWPVESYQDVVDRTRGRIQWVQIGESQHDHPDLRGVIDLRGQTDLRQLIRLAFHARGGLGGVTLLQHLLAAWQKPYVCLLGGREPATWVAYPLQSTLHTIGSYQLSCCRLGACWRSRVVPLSDPQSPTPDPKDSSLCENPVFGLSRPVGRCMTMITPSAVVAALERVC